MLAHASKASMANILQSFCVTPKQAILYASLIGGKKKQTIAVITLNF